MFTDNGYGLPQIISQIMLTDSDSITDNGYELSVINIDNGYELPLIISQIMVTDNGYGLPQIR